MALDIFPNKTYVDKIKEYLEGLISQISLTWDKITGKPDFKAVATSGSYNDLTDKPTIPEGADVLTLDGQRVIKNGTTEITTYNDLLALVTKGGVVLLDTVAGTIAKEALFHPHMADETAIRFDATGTLGEKVYTRSFAFTPKADGGITVSRGNLTEVAKKSDVPAVVAPASDMALGKAADAKLTGEALPLFFDNDLAKALFRFGDGGEPVLDQSNYGVRYHFPTNVEGDIVLALVSQLSGITEEDIADFLKYKGWLLNNDGDWLTDIELEVGDIALNPLDSQYLLATGAIPKGSVLNTVFAKSVLYIPTEGFKKLLKLFGSDNEYLKTALFTDTAFSQKLHYALNNDGTIKDRAVNKLTWTAESESHSFSLDANLPAPVDGVGRDFLVQIHTDAAVDITSALALKGDLPSITEAGDYILAFTELHDNMWLVKKLTLEDAQ